MGCPPDCTLVSGDIIPFPTDKQRADRRLNAERKKARPQPTPQEIHRLLDRLCVAVGLDLSKMPPWPDGTV
jgi:hypothetical protein